MTLMNNHRERIRFFRFMVVGLIGAAVDFSAFNLYSLLFHVPLLWASILSFSTAVISNFLWNRYWTYPDSRSKPISRQLFQFTLVNVIGLLIRTPLFAVLESPLGRFFTSLPLGLPFPAEILGHNLALAIAVVVVMLWNFFINRYWTYNDVSKS